MQYHKQASKRNGRVIVGRRFPAFLRGFRPLPRRWSFDDARQTADTSLVARSPLALVLQACSPPSLSPSLLFLTWVRVPTLPMDPFGGESGSESATDCDRDYEFLAPRYHNFLAEDCNAYDDEADKLFGTPLHYDRATPRPRRLLRRGACGY